MSYMSRRRSESSTSRRSADDSEMNCEERDESKRRSRNLSEKKRRDQFNILINELSTMVTSSRRKMDKSTVLKATIAYLKAHNELSTHSKINESSENWRPSFLSNEEFTYLMLEALDGFVMVIASSGRIIYVSESVTSLLGHLPSDLVGCSFYDFILLEERSALYAMLGSIQKKEMRKSPLKQHNTAIALNFRRGGLEVKPSSYKYHLVRLSGYTKPWISGECSSDDCEMNKEDDEEDLDEPLTKSIFVCTGRVINSELVREMSVVVDSTNTEFSSRYSLEWKFLFLDHRAPPIIGYLPFEVLGTSGYDYYHVEDLDKVSSCHEALMQKGEGTSCYYRFLTKGHQWIWLQTRYYITYHQWNSKPEFVVGTHRVVSYENVMKELRAAEPNRSYVKKVESTLNSETKFKCSSLPSCKDGTSIGDKSRTNNIESYLRLFLPVKTSLSRCRNFELPPKFLPTVPFGDQVTPIVSPPPAKIQRMSGYPGTSCDESEDKSGIPVDLGSQLCSSSYTTPSENQDSIPIAHPISQFNFSDSEENMVSSSRFNVHENTSLAPASSSNSILLLPPAQSVLQEQLLRKQAALQRQIQHQQEELRRVSEQLLINQCDITPSPTPSLPPILPSHRASNSVTTPLGSQQGPRQIQAQNTDQKEQTTTHSTF